MKNLMRFGAGGTEDELKLLRTEFLETSESLNNEIEVLKKNLIQSEEQLAALKTTCFSWRTVSDHAQKIQEIMLEKDPVSLKAAYRSLFSKIIISDEDEMGKRKVKYVLNGGPDHTPTNEDGVCYNEQMVENSGNTARDFPPGCASTST